MEINSAITVLSSVSSVIKDIKSIAEKLPIKITLPPNRGKLIQLQEKITLLEKSINTGFPKLAQLVRSYSQINSEVKVAKAISDKAAELIGSFPSLQPGYISIFTNQVESDLGRITTGIGQLPAVDNVVTGELNRELSIIRDLIRDLKREEQQNTKNIKRLFDDISTHYTDIQSILSKLLESTLACLDLRQ